MDSLPHFAWSRMTSIDTGFQSCRTTDSVRAAILTSTLQLDLVKNFFPSKRPVKNVRQNFHCICANCRNIYNDLRNDTNGGDLLPFESLAKLKRK